MTRPPKMRDTDPADHPRKGRAARPKLAATLILHKGDGADMQILMGKRAPRHGFMPGKFVFPGGKVDRADSFAPIASQLPAASLNAMTTHLPKRRAIAAASAAIREAWEETGLKLAAPLPAARSRRGFEGFTEQGLGFDLARLNLLARAITPPYHPKRFDTWFFTASAATLIDDPADMASGELLELQWVTLTQARSLDLPKITQMILFDLQERGPEPTGPLPFYVSRYGKHICEAL